MPAFALAAACSIASATPVSVASLARQPERPDGRCVTLTAWSDGFTLFADRAAWRQLSRSDAAGRPPTALLRTRFIGAYDMPDEAFLERGASVRRWTVAGLVSDCAQNDKEIGAGVRREADHIVITMSAGFCHSRTGPILTITEARASPEK